MRSLRRRRWRGRSRLRHVTKDPPRATTGIYMDMSRFQTLSTDAPRTVMPTLSKSSIGINRFKRTTNFSVKFVIGLRNADGHVSEIRASLPAALVLPPYISSAGTTPHLDDSTVNHLSYLDSGDCLPSYESRIFDRLWDGVSYGGLDTSALNTPMTMSRRTSAENLRDLNSEIMPNPGDLEASLHQALREQRNSEEPRLEDSSGHDHSSDSLHGMGAANGGTSASAPMMRQQTSQQSVNVPTVAPSTGDDEHPHLSPTSSPEMQHISPTTSNGSQSSVVISPPNDSYIDMGRLSRVPSYNTANSSNILNLDPITNALPTYANAMSTLEVIPEQPRSRSGSSASNHSRHSPESQSRRPPPAVGGVSTEGMQTGFGNVGRIQSVYGAPQTFDDPMRRISLMRSLFSNR